MKKVSSLKGRTKKIRRGRWSDLYMSIRKGRKRLDPVDGASVGPRAKEAQPVNKKKNRKKKF